VVVGSVTDGGGGEMMKVVGEMMKKDKRGIFENYGVHQAKNKVC